MKYKDILIRDKSVTQASQDLKFKRNAYYEIIELLKTNLRGIIISGLRQIGKTTIIKQLRISQKNSLFINISNFIDRSNVLELSQIIENFYYRGKRLFLIDETQNIKEWGHFITDLSNNLPEAKFVITGSASLNAKDSRGSARFTTYNLLPLSFEEYCKYKGYRKDEPLRLIFNEYAGISSIFAYTDRDKIDINEGLKNYLESYFYVDLRKYNPNIKIVDIRKILDFFTHNTSGEVIKKDIMKLGVGENYKTLKTKYQYLDKHLKILEDYCLIKILKRYSFDGGHGKSYKTYLNPHLYLMLMGVDNPKYLSNGNKGYFFESYIYFYNVVDRIKGYIKQSSNAEKYAKQEIDFITNTKWIEVKATEYVKNVKKSLSKMFLEGNKKGITKQIISLSDIPEIKGITNNHFIDLITKNIK